MNVTAKNWGTAPFVVSLAAVIALCKAFYLIALGILGAVIADSVGDTFSWGILVFGAVYAVVGFLVPRGSRLARAVLGLLSLVTAVIGVVYAFTGPSSAVVPSLVATAFALIVLLALYWPESARAYFAH
jgi:hypothetical protein